MAAVGRWGAGSNFEGAKREGWNFLSNHIREAARARMAQPQKDQTLLEERLWSDLLSSMPMCFNLFGRLWNDAPAATRALNAWVPDLPGEVEELIFEWSPGRLDRHYLNNKSAFDAAFLLRLSDGGRGVLGVETKYHEVALPEKAPSGDKLQRYTEVTDQSNIFTRDWQQRLIGTDLQQLWLDHLLALSMHQHPELAWSWVRFLLVYPERNTSFARAAIRYQEVLRDNSTFEPRTVESLLEADVLPDGLMSAFRERYLW